MSEPIAASRRASTPASRVAAASSRSLRSSLLAAGAVVGATARRCGCSAKSAAYAGAGAALEPARRLRRARLGRPAGLRRPRRLRAVRAARSSCGVDPLLAIPLAGLAAALLAVPTASLVFRLPGAYFAIGTWVVAEVFRLLARAGQGARRRHRHSACPTARACQRHRPPTRRPARGRRSTGWRWRSPSSSSAPSTSLLRSRYGLALAAIRDNEAGRAQLGVDVIAHQVRRLCRRRPSAPAWSAR